MSDRFNLLPDERFTPLKSALTERMTTIGRVITPDNFRGVCSPLITNLLRETFRLAGGQEGSIWLTDHARQNLVISYNSGPNAAQITGFKQPLNRGIISAVYASQQGMVENEVYANEDHDRTLTDKLKQLTYAMVAVPFYFLNECRGVISCVQLTTAEALENGQAPLGFSRSSLQAVQTAASVTRELIDAHLLAITVGYKES